MPMTNVPLLGWEVDAYWPDQKVVVELDGYEWHKTRADFERDRLKQEQLQVAGLPPLRFTYRSIRRRPHEVAASLEAVLAR
jgi:very-short-patch-repair endonuclease